MKKTYLIFITGAGMLLAACNFGGDKNPTYKDSNAPIEKRVDDLLDRMTFE